MNYMKIPGFTLHCKNTCAAFHIRHEFGISQQFTHEPSNRSTLDLPESVTMNHSGNQLASNLHYIKKVVSQAQSKPVVLNRGCKTGRKLSGGCETCQVF
jgi:hypothetical protein